MASDLKRVGLVLTAEGATDFVKSMKDINALTRENYSAFKLAKAQWDESTSAIKKLQDTQKYLTVQTEAYTDKVTILKRELNELETAEVRDESAISKKKIALNNARASLARYKKGLEETEQALESGQSQIDEYVNKIENFGNRTKKIGEGMTKGVTAPIVATGTAAMAAWFEIDDAYDNIAKGTGAVGDTLSSLHESFDNVYGSMPADSDVVSAAIADINTRLGFTKGKLEDASEYFIKFAEVNNTDVSSAIALVSRAMGDANIPATEYAGVLDALTVASQSTGISIERLTEMVTKYGAPMRALGYNTKESIAMLSSWEKSGVNIEIAFSGMKKAISNFASSGKDAKKEFKNMLVEIQRAPDISAATTKAIEIFGAKAGPDLADAIKNGRFEFQEMVNLIDDAGGQLENSFDATLDPIDEATIATNNLKLAGSQLGTEMQIALTPAFSTLTDVLSDFTQWFKNLNPELKQTIVITGMILAVLGTLLVIIGAIAGPISIVISLFGKFRAAMIGMGSEAGLLSTALGAINIPLIAIISIIAIVIAAIIDLWNTNESFRQNVLNIIKNVSEVFINFWTTILKPILESISNLLKGIFDNAIKPLWDGIKNFISDVIANFNKLIEQLLPIINLLIYILSVVLIPVFGLVSGAVSDAISTCIGLLNAFMGSLSGIVNGIFRILNGIIDFITGIFTGNWSRAWQGLVDIFGGIFDTLVAIAKAPLNAIIGLLNGCIDGINLMVKGLNKINFEVPEWVPRIGGKKFGFNLKKVGHIPYLAKGGNLLKGTAVVGEAGPELLQQLGNKTRVTPLTESGGTNQRELIDYDKMARVFIKAVLQLKLKLDKRELAKFVREVV